MPTESELYRPISALKASDFNTCFYCGCIATKMDLVPPLKHAAFYLSTREQADFYSVPACLECYELLKPEKSALLGQRSDKVKQKLAKKYKRAIRVYEMWDEEELVELDYQLKKSVAAGLKLGEDAYSRVHFKGYDFKADGEKHSAFYTKPEELSVFGDKFHNFRDALDYASKAYRIPKSKLRELFAEHNNNFDSAIRFYQDEMERKLFEKELKEKSKEFAKQHYLNPKFVMRTVELYIKENSALTIDAALKKLFNLRIKKTSSQSAT